MPDGRMLSKTIAHNEQLAEVSLEADYLFARCVPHLDREGRMAGNAKLVKSIACPLRLEITVEDIPALLRELGGAKLIRWYAVDGREVLEFPGFKNHQKGFRFDREAESRFPEHTARGAVDLLRTNSGPTPDKVRTSEVEVEVEVKLSEVEVKGPTTPPTPLVMETAKQAEELAKLEMWADFDKRNEHLTGFDRMKAEGLVRGIIDGDTGTAWETEEGTRVPWPERPRLMRMAMDETSAGGGKIFNVLRGLVIPREFHPFAVRKSSDPKPGAEAPAVVRQPPDHVAELEKLRTEHPDLYAEELGKFQRTIWWAGESEEQRARHLKGAVRERLSRPRIVA